MREAYTPCISCYSECVQVVQGSPPELPDRATPTPHMTKNVRLVRRQEDFIAVTSRGFSG